MWKAEKKVEVKKICGLMNLMRAKMEYACWA